MTKDVPKDAAKDATAFASDDVTASAQPTGTVTIGGHEYVMEAPKLRTWYEVLELLDNYSKSQAIQPHVDAILAKMNAELTDTELDKLIDQLKVLQQTVRYAVGPLELAEHLLKFFCDCMVDEADGKHLQTAYKRARGGIDMADLRLALDTIEEQPHFIGYLREQAEMLGLELDDATPPQNREGRRAAARKSPGTTSTTSRTTTRGKRVPARAG